MNTEHILFAAIWAGYLSLHSALATTRVKVALYGWIPAAQYRLFFNALALLLLVPLVWAYLRCAPVVLWPNAAIRNVLGGALLVAGGVLLKVAFRQYDSGEFLGLRPAAAGAPLATKGLNAYVRHPLYAATFLLLFGWPLLSGTLAAVLLSGIGSLYLVVGTYWEERKLVREFGADYLAYKAQVPRFFPRIFL